MTESVPIIDIVARILIAVALGAVIGLERQWRLRTAGIRTNALVSVGAALFVIVGSVGIGQEQSSDPTRVAAQVVSGIGFLGAGVILRDGLKVRGLTTAATLWCAAAVGALSGAGQGWIALAGAMAIVGTNTVLRPLSRSINQRMNHDDPSGNNDDAIQAFVLEVIASEKSEARVHGLVLQATSGSGLTLRGIESKPAKGGRVRVRATVTSRTPADGALLEHAVHAIGLDPKVVSARWWTTEVDE